VGKDADLLLIDGDPLKCIDVLLDAEKRIAVMQGGRFVSGALATE
jgi:imidazolonepropionase-like amidohydrolase